MTKAINVEVVQEKHSKMPLNKKVVAVVLLV